MYEKPIVLTGLLTGLLVLWSIVTAGVFATLDLRETALLGWALIGVVVVAPLAGLFRGAGAVATVMAMVVYMGAQLYRLASPTGPGLELRSATVPLPGVFCLLVAGLLSNGVAGRLRKLGAQLHRDITVIKELTRHDDLTGTLKGVYADKVLVEEIARARRYKRPLSVVLMGPDDWAAVVKERGEEQATEALKLAGVLLQEKLRDVDKVARHEECKFIAILPETPAEGANIVGERLCQSVTTRISVLFRAGVAEFPTDAVSKDELISEAEAALTFARTSGLTLASRRLLV